MRLVEVAEKKGRKAVDALGAVFMSRVASFWLHLISAPESA